MEVVSNRRLTTNLLVKVMDTALVELEEERVSLEEAIKSQINILLNLVPPYITNII